MPDMNEIEDPQAELFKIGSALETLHLMIPAFGDGFTPEQVCGMKYMLEIIKDRVFNVAGDERLNNLGAGA